MSDLALAFDLDGVLLDSETVKLQAFASLFSDYPQMLDAITAYNATQRGVPRADKMNFICRRILQLPNPDVAAQVFLARYADRLALLQEQVTPMSGIAAFLDRTPLPKYVCSSAPADEVTALLTRHTLAQYFVHLWGYPTTKVQALQQLTQRYARVIFFGDADADYVAAQMVGAGFIAVVTPDTRARFRQRGVPMIEQFHDTAHIHDLLRRLYTSSMSAALMLVS